MNQGGTHDVRTVRLFISKSRNVACQSTIGGHLISCQSKSSYSIIHLFPSQPKLTYLSSKSRLESRLPALIFRYNPLHDLTLLTMHIIHHSEHKRYNNFVRSTGDVICKQDMR
ncbi:hypothetical protein PILCRDRAFT_629125 [Piloderma croceum F 1598]|uniref:Uncharacterized protein n=1 Tax=Piloderma croceum (strain F 1598) TaxID=765440 RepID=A0A0C3FB71_PILCF|nr:hypothetical protein PILCRDRAFT_629125 [Piloderma croceum F 1598]